MKLRSLLSNVRHPTKMAHSIYGLRRLYQVRHQREIPLIGGEDIVVTMTSYGARLSTVYIAIKSMMLQSVPPNKIVLYIDNDSSDVVLPADLLELKEYGLRIASGVQNLGPHTKYHYALMDYPNSCLITVDDDMIYESDVVESLLECHSLFPDSVIARRVHRINVVDGEVVPYSQWNWEWRDSNAGPKKSLFATGVGGVLYPPHILPNEVLNVKTKMELCPYADDIWLKACESLVGVPVTWARSAHQNPYFINNTQTVALNTRNVSDGGNDVQLMAVMDRYGLTSDSFVDATGM